MLLIMACYDTHGKRWVSHSTTAPYCHMHTLDFVPVVHINLALGIVKCTQL
jgi:hypothetical protein